MEKTFTIHVGQKDFTTDGDLIEQSFTNDLGTWHVIVKRAFSSIAGTVSLRPVLNIQDESFSKIMPKIVLTNSSSTSYNIEATAMKIPDQFCFLYGVYCGGFHNSRYTYEIKVDIDISSLDLNATIPTSIDHYREMYATEKLADITIIVNGKKKIKAHNFVLSRSKVFDAMLNAHDTKEAQEGVIEITDIEHKVMVEMIRYMYTDEIPKMKEMACKLLLAANKYDLQGLANACGNYLIKNVAVESFAEVLITADNLEIPQLKDAAIDFVIANRKDIFTCDGWKRLKKSNIELAMEVLEKYVATA